MATFIGLHRAGIELAVICPQATAGRTALADAGVRVLDIRLRGRFDAAATRSLREELQRGGYDILHLLGNRALQNGLRAARGMSVGVIAYRGIVGNVSFLSPISWLRFLSPRIDRIVCVADAVRDFFLQMRPAALRLPAERLVTIHKGHSLDWYAEPPADLSEFGIPAEAFVVGCVAAYRPRKGIEKLVEAMAGLPEDWQVRLLLVGDMDAPRLDRAIAASPARAAIHRVGYRPDAPALTAACDVFVLPSVRREGLPRAVIEAMAYRVPAIVTDCGGSPELVVDGVTGLIVPPGDASALNAAIRRMHADPAMRRRMGEAARRRIETDFRIDATIEKTIALYRSLVAETAV